jgi:tol-pal system protein YbgF
MQKQLFRSLGVLVASAALTTSVIAREDTSQLSERERIERLERLVEGQGLVDLLMRLDSLQQEVQQLRGDSEVHGHTLSDIKKRQRDLYIDIDRRLLQLERSNAGAVARTPAVPVSPQTTPGTTTPATSSGSPAVNKQLEPPVVSKASSSQAPADDVTEQQAYQKAFNLLRELRYAKAMEAFREFIERYPNGRYAHIAQYWLGEAGYAQGQFKVAIQDYQALLDNYENSPKRAQAMLKIGYSHYKLKNTQAARNSFNQVIKTYPGTTEAGQAKKMLKEIKRKRN